MLAHRYRLPLGLVTAAIAAGGATLLLRPRAGVVHPAAASAGDYFTPEQLERTRAFRRTQRALAIGATALEGSMLVLLVLRPPRALRRGLERAGARPLAGAAVAGAALTTGFAVVGLPMSAIAHQRSRNVGLATQGWGPWLGDVAKSTAVAGGMSAGGAAIAIGVIRRFPGRWWLPAAVAATGLSTLMVFLAPVVIDPLFNKFEPLPDGRLRSEVLALADQAGVDVGQVYRVDASRRTTATNAYVWGIGRTKRVVIYDTLIRDLPEDQVRSVVAHELSHVVHRDVLRGLLWMAIVAPAGAFLTMVVAERLSGGRTLGLPVALPGLALAGGLVSSALGFASNLLSRRVEARADTYALDLTGDPTAFIGLARSLTTTNVADPEPPRIFHVLLGTHPTTMERIGAGLAWTRS
jgi:STE24 endopeptidase